MDVRCSTCNEPWDVDHLRHEAIFETALSGKEVKAWQSLPPAQKLSARYRKEFRTAGWEFGHSVINVVRCPCCPKEAKPNAERILIKAALEDMLGDDLDSLASTFEDYSL